MFLRISAYADTERFFTLGIEPADGLYQLIGMTVAGRVGSEPLLAAYRIAAQRHQVADTEESVIVQVAFYFFS